MSIVGLYVDVENLQEIAKQAIVSTINNWPEDFPQLNVLHLYVRGDQTEIWGIWANNEFSSLEVQVNGVQHYTVKGSKNSADISLALDALSDFLQGRITHTTILSDDSDFAILYAKIKGEYQGNAKDTPFRWFITNRPDTRSPILGEFFPKEHLLMINCTSNVKTQSKETLKRSITEIASNEEEQIALTIIQHSPIGNFKSTDCKKIIDYSFPHSHLAKLDSATFGTQFLKTIWPALEKYGVILIPGKKPRKYEMTKTAKEEAGFS